MTAETAVSVKIDTEAGAAYLRLGRGQVARTVEFTEDVYVDLDQFGVVVGIELLDLDTPLPLDELAARFHINASALDVLMKAIQWSTPRRTVTSGSSPSQSTSFSSMHTASL
ncbi:MAG: DUF2283 domain-containing protein [Pseudonocardiaceae bacterium]